MTEERTLLRQAQAGDQEAFGQLVALHQSMVYGVALTVTRSPQDAEEVAQTAFLKAWKALPDFQEGSALSTWLYRLTRNAAIDHLRRGKKRAGDRSLEDQALTTLPHPGPGPQEILEQKERQQALLEALDKLPEDHRQVLILREFRGHSYHEMAETLAIPEGTVRSRLSRARRALRELLLADGNFSDRAASNQRKGGMEG